MKSLDRLREIQNKNSKIVKAVKNTNFESRKETTSNDFSAKVGFEEPTKLTKPLRNSQGTYKSPRSDDIWYPEVAELARLRTARRYDFAEGGQRIFHPQGRFVALSSELIATWKLAESAVGKRLTVWGTAHEELPQIPDEITLVEYGQARNICEQQRSLWCSMTREEQHEFAVSVALLNAGYDVPNQ